MRIFPYFTFLVYLLFRGNLGVTLYKDFIGTKWITKKLRPNSGTSSAYTTFRSKSKGLKA